MYNQKLYKLRRRPFLRIADEIFCEVRKIKWRVANAEIAVMFGFLKLVAYESVWHYKFRLLAIVSLFVNTWTNKPCIIT
jgi:hypothetical protein